MFGGNELELWYFKKIFTTALLITKNLKIILEVFFLNSSNIRNYNYVYYVESAFFQTTLTFFPRYACQFCGKGFYYKSFMLNHQRLHTGDYKECICDLCGAVYKSVQVNLTNFFFKNWNFSIVIFLGFKSACSKCPSGS